MACLNTKQSAANLTSKDKQALERNAPCLCGSEKKYKKCCA
ncbi:SEC-C metal-binding domain-containing protein [Pseudoalteromonas aliena]